MPKLTIVSTIEVPNGCDGRAFLEEFAGSNDGSEFLANARFKITGDCSGPPRLNDFVEVHKYRGHDDCRGRIAFVRTGAEYNGRNYCVSSGNMPFCGSIDEWLSADEFTVYSRD